MTIAGAGVTTAGVTMAGTAAGLLWNSLAEQPVVWPLFVLVAINAGVSAIDNPARHALTPGLVGRELLPSSLALNQILHNIAAASLPAVAGLLIATAGLPWTYGIEMVTALRALPAFSRLPVIVLSTAATELNRQKLEQLGVVAVLAKQRFDEAELKQLVEKCITTRA